MTRDVCTSWRMVDSMGNGSPTAVFVLVRGSRMCDEMGWEREPISSNPGHFWYGNSASVPT